MDLVPATRSCAPPVLPPNNKPATRRSTTTDEGVFTSMFQDLNFDLPCPMKSPAMESPFSSRQAFEDWYRQFQISNPEQTAQALEQVMADMNATRLPADERLYVLTRLYGYVTLTAELFSEHSYPGSEDLFAKLARQQAVLEQFAQGCCRVVQDLIDDSSPERTEDAMLIRAIHMAIESYSHLLVEGYASNFVGVEAAWKSVNQLYLLAERLNLAEQAMVNQATIQHSYLRIAILALSNPFHLMPGEARLLYKKLDEWGRDARLLPWRSLRLSGKAFVDLATGRAPVRLRRCDDQPLRPREGRIIDLERMVAGLDELLQGLKLTQQREGRLASLNQRIQRDFYLRLREAWAERKERQSERNECWQELEVATGLSAVNFYMRAHQGADSDENVDYLPEPSESLADSHLTLIDNPRNPGNQRRDVWSRIDVEEQWLVQGAQQVTASDQYPLNTWLQCDVSEGGIAVCHARDRARFSGSGEITDEGASFSLPSAASTRVRVGDLIAYRSRDNRDGCWEVGAVRWMRLDRRSGVKLGIMRISAAAEAARVRAINGVGAGTTHGDALLVDDDSLQGGAIITPAAIYDIGTRLELAEGRLGRKLIRLSRQILSSARFSMFEFQMI